MSRQCIPKPPPQGCQFRRWAGVASSRRKAGTQGLPGFAAPSRSRFGFDASIHPRRISTCVPRSGPSLPKSNGAAILPPDNTVVFDGDRPLLALVRGRVVG